MKAIYFRKLYQRVTDRDYGAIYHSIIIFEKIPHMYYAHALSSEESKVKGYGIEQITTQHKCYLTIDLWLFIIRFEWLTKKLKERK